MFIISVLCCEHYHFNIQLFMKRAVRKVEPYFERIFKFSIARSRSQKPDAYGSQEEDGKKLLPSVPGTSELFFSTLYYVLDRIKANKFLKGYIVSK